MSGLLALAFGAGLLAPVNPCGFGLLPAMLTTTLGQPTGGRSGAPGGRGLAARLAAGLRAGLALALGFTATFTVIGLGLTAGIRSLITVVPWLAAALGAVLVLVGLALLVGWHLPVPRRLHTRAPEPARTLGSGTARIVAFGAGYAVASASCTLAVLLAVVSQAAATTLVGAVAVFAAYAAGSALLLVTLAVLTAVAGYSLARAMQRVARHAGRIAGGLLAVSGAYLLSYWLPQLLGAPRPGDGGPADLSDLAGRVATAIAEHQLAVVLAAAGLVAAAAMISTQRARIDSAAQVAGSRSSPSAALWRHRSTSRM